MTNIPQARLILEDVRQELRTGSCRPGEAAARIEEALSMMTRSTPVRRAREKSKPITPEVKAQIRQLAKTDLHMSEIGHHLGVNPGRVSEVLRGKR